jgi:hypothetical protein
VQHLSAQASFLQDLRALASLGRAVAHGVPQCRQRARTPALRLRVRQLRPETQLGGVQCLVSFTARDRARPFEPLVRWASVRLNWLPKRDFYLPNLLNINTRSKLLGCPSGIMHWNLLARQPDLVIGKKIVVPSSKTTISSLTMTISQFRITQPTQQTFIKRWFCIFMTDENY